ncbi:MAG: LacI family transcriptional regulator [Lachnospiraceae bacterium]|nr:LacI family transcriptional regulator [Lachnospiraceae bacterium]
MATIQDIANRLGISASTVSKGLNGANDISEQLRQTVLETAVEMGYTPRQMRTKGIRKLCVFIENMSYQNADQFGYDIILGFKQAAYPARCDVNVMPVTPEFQALEKYDTYMLKNGYAGAFLVGFALQDPWMEQLATTTIPTTLFDNYIRKNPNVSYIGTDSYEGIDDAIEHLIALGHKKIAMFSGSAHSMITEQRRLAYIESMASHNLEVNEKWMPYGYYVAAAAKDHVAELLSLGATAIVCGNDLLASGVLDECKGLGYKVPEDVSIIGFDDIPLSAKLAPPLTTVRQDRIELGKCGFYTLSSTINHVSVSKNLLRPQLILRESTGPVRK